jgi:hypothetical protein
MSWSATLDPVPVRVSHRRAPALLAGLLLMQALAALPAQAQPAPAPGSPPGSRLQSTPGATSTPLGTPLRTPAGSATAAPGTPATLTLEVDALLAAVEHSGCEFNRNGSWYGAQGAQAHLRDKFIYLHDKIHSAEDFIELAATRSAMSGTPYAMRCAGQNTSTHQWLIERLAALRAAR